eukprot:6374317-Prorocentrum_lima.AAC.1
MAGQVELDHVLKQHPGVGPAALHLKRQGQPPQQPQQAASGEGVLLCNLPVVCDLWESPFGGEEVAVGKVQFAAKK